MSSQHPRSRRLRRPLAIAVALGLGLAGPLVVATPAFAATWIVTVETDVLPVPDVGSLRWAVGQATSGDTITFDTSTVDRIEVADDLTLPKGITIDGPGTDLLTIGRAVAGDYWQLGLRPDVVDQDYTIRDLTIEGRPDSTGSGIYSSFGPTYVARDITLSNIVIQDEIDQYGPAVNIYVIDRNLVIDDSVFQDNHATAGVGGALSLDRVTGDITITNSLLVDNSALNEGGGADITDAGSDSEILIRDTAFISNSAESGGGLSVRGANSVELSDVAFFDNSALQRGGGAYIGWNGADGVNELRVEDSLFEDNVSVQEGGGLAVDHLVGEFEVVDSTFEGNDSTWLSPLSYNGGGISIDQINEDSLIFGSTFEANDVLSGYGGGVYVGSIAAGAALEVTDSTFFQNRSQLGGGGLAVGSTAGGTNDGLRIANSTFAQNGIFSGIAGGSSIAIQSVDAPFFMAQTTVDDQNFPEAEGAVFIQEVNADSGLAVAIGSATIVGPGGVLIRNHTNGDVIVTHSILDSLSATLLALEVENPSQDFEISLDWSLLSSGMQSYYNSIAGNTFNVADMELGTLADNGGPTPTRLPLNGSPAINGGDPSVSAPTATDQREAGFFRVAGGRIDIGAVELQTLALAATGVTVNWFLLGGGGALLLLGLGLVLWVRLRRSGSHRA